MIQVDLITGFLGSGKTTFLLEYARYLMKQGKRIGILEYDYGSVNVDMLLLNELRGENCELEMVAAGCDTDCLNRRFRTKLISMAMSGYDRVIIEPSGVFDMDLFFDTLRDDTLENWYKIGSVITIVNANLRENLTKEEDFFLASQAASAGCVVFSRAQLSTEKKMEKTKQAIYDAMERIQCKKEAKNMLIKDWADLTDEDFKMLSGCGYKLPSYVKQIAGKELEISSVCFLNVADTLNEMKEKIGSLFGNREYGSILRIKGFVVEKDKSYQINASQYELEVKDAHTDQGVMIVIGSGLDEEKIKACIETT